MNQTHSPENSVFRRIVYFSFALMLLAAAYVGFSVGFSKLANVRQLDRLPLSPIASLTQGEYLVSGLIVNADQSIVTPYAKESVIYYAYQLTETYTDSDGNQQTRTLDRGESATAFLIQDSTGQLLVQPGFQISDIRFKAPQTYQLRQGNLTYTEHSLRAGDQIQLIGEYQPGTATLEFPSNMTHPKYISSNKISQATGQSLLTISLVLSLSTGGLAIGLALLLSSLAVHRYWVFVATMIFGLVASLSYLGIHWVNLDWQRANHLFKTRLEGVAQQPNNLHAQADVYRYFLRIKNSAQGWPDSALFSVMFEFDLQPSALTSKQKEQIQSEANARAFSRLEPLWLGNLLALLGVFVSLLFVWLALKAIRFKRLLEFIPTSKSVGLSYGLTELNGFADAPAAGDLLMSPLNQQACFAYQYSIEEQQGSGKNQRWVEIESGHQSIPFWLSDDQGRVRVFPDHATVQYSEHSTKQQGSRRYSERWLKPNSAIYCLGFAGIDALDHGRLAVVKDPNDDIEFLITAKTEQQVIQDKGVNGFVFTGIALMFGMMAATLWLTSTRLFSPLDLLTVALVVPFILLFMTVAMHYNSLVFLRQRVSKTRGDIESLLQKRAELFPRLMSVVSAYLAHESQLMEQITQVRSQLRPITDSLSEAETQFGLQKNVQNTLVAVLEQYPELKANSIVKMFMQQMSEAEEELALVRQGYNDAVMLYNNQIEKLPDIVLAKLCAFRPSPPFQMAS